MRLSGKDAANIVYGNHEAWVTVQKWPTSSSRWSICYAAICEHIPSEKFYLFRYSIGATDQPYYAFEYDKFVEPKEVSRHMETVSVWKQDDKIVALATGEQYD